jgi:hypothetical protein
MSIPALSPSGHDRYTAARRLLTSIGPMGAVLRW